MSTMPGRFFIRLGPSVSLSHNPPGVQLSDEVLEAGPGDFVLKSRGVAHACWNGAMFRARMLELISPAGFENYIRELAPLLAADREDGAIGEVVARYRLDIDFSTIPLLAEQHGLALASRADPQDRARIGVETR
jgi:hypothetical protein